MSTTSSSNLKKLAFLSLAGVTAGGLIWYLINSVNEDDELDTEQNDEQLLEILREMLKKTHIPRLKMAESAKGIMRSLRNKGQMKGRMTQKDLQKMVAILHSEKLPHLAEINKITDDILSPHELTIQDFKELTEERMKENKEIGGLSKKISQGLFIACAGVEPVFEDDLPEILTSELILELVQSTNFRFLKQSLDIAEQFINEGKPVLGELSKPFHEALMAISLYEVIGEMLKEYPVLETLKFHPINYYLLAVKHYTVSDRAYFGKRADLCRNKNVEIYSSLIKGPLSLEILGEMRQKIDSFDLNAEITEQETKEEELIQEIKRKEKELLEKAQKQLSQKTVIEEKIEEEEEPVKKEEEAPKEDVEEVKEDNVSEKQEEEVKEDNISGKQEEEQVAENVPEESENKKEEEVLVEEIVVE